MNLDYQVSLNRNSDWHMHRHHFHEGYEVLLSLSDGGNFFAENTLYPLKRGTLLLLEDTVLHHSMANTSDVYERYVLHFTHEVLATISTPQTDLLSKFSGMNRGINLDENRLLQLIELFEKCLQPRSNAFGDDLRHNADFTELLLEICILLDNNNAIDTVKTENFTRVAPILEYIQCNLNEELSLDSIADYFFMNKYYLCHIFKKSTGFSVREYIIHYRVLKARALLRDGYSVQAAGEQAGFQNNAHFIRTFGKLSGTSPGRYRKKYKTALSNR